METSYIIGLNIGNHDSSAVLLKDGEIISFIEQERISRNKMAIGEAPIDAIKACLTIEGISLKDVEAVTVGMDWAYRDKLYNEPIEEKKKYKQFRDENWFLPKKIFGEEIPSIYSVRHHLSHASSAYRTSGFEECAILVIDNRGEDSSTSLGYAKQGKITFFKQYNIPNSLGIFYNRACRYTGLYGKYREVGKFMGLASYGNPCMKMPIEKDLSDRIFVNYQNVENTSIYDSIQIRTQQFENYFRNNCFPFDSGNSEDIMSYANFAASVQNTLEDTILNFVSVLKKKTHSDNLVIAGGVALNCSANGKIEQANLFKNIYIPPFASDAGTSIGSALQINYELHGKSRIENPLLSASLGIEYSADAILNTLKQYINILDWTVEVEDILVRKIADSLSQGRTVAWMQGKFEAGPRALGNRSILADARNRKSLIRLNNIKGREMWRPIAPIILDKFYSDYFSGSANNKYFMNVACNVKQEKQKFIPAVVHVDGSARPQIVTMRNQRLYKLINEFYKITNIPILCNTSFNLQGSPLVNSPKDAIECFLKSKIDLLVMENIIVTRKSVI